MKNKKIIKLLTCAGILAILCAILMFSISNADTTSRYDDIQNLRVGYKERAQIAGIEEAQLPENILKGNKDTIDKTLLNEDLFINKELFTNEEKIIRAEFLTYEEFINTSSADLETYIDKDRMIFVAVIQYPNGFTHPRLGFVENAEITSYYDVETCDVIGNGIRSLNPDLKIEKSKAQ